MAKPLSTTPVIPTGYESLYSDIERKRKVADALTAAGLAPREHKSWVGALGQIAQAWAGKSLDKEAHNAETDLGIRRQADYTNATNLFGQALESGGDVGELASKYGANPMLQSDPRMQAVISAYAKRLENQQEGTVGRMLGPDGRPVSTVTDKTGGVRQLEGGYQVPGKVQFESGVAYDPETTKPGTIINDPDKVGIYKPDGTLGINQPLVDAKGQLAAAGRTQVTTQNFLNTGEKSYGATFGETMGKADAEGFQAAIAAPQMYASATQIINTLGKAPITGSFQQQRYQLHKLLATAGLADPNDLASTEVLSTQMAKAALATAQAAGLGSKMFDSNQEKALLDRAAAGTMDMTPQGLLAIARFSQRVAKQAQEKGFSILKTIESNPATAAQAEPFRNRLGARIGEETSQNNTPVRATTQQLLAVAQAMIPGYTPKPGQATRTEGQNRQVRGVPNSMHKIDPRDKNSHALDIGHSQATPAQIARLNAAYKAKGYGVQLVREGDHWHFEGSPDSQVESILQHYAGRK